LTSVPRAPIKIAVNMLIVTIPLDHTNVRAVMDILEMARTVRPVNIALALIIMSHGYDPQLL